MRAKEIRFTKGGEHCEKRLCRAHFRPEGFKGVGQSMADRKAERAQAKGVEEGGDLVCGAHRGSIAFA